MTALCNEKTHYFFTVMWMRIYIGLGGCLLAAVLEDLAILHKQLS